MRYAVLLMLALGCYEAPDYSGTRFKCDADHGCPEGQTCVSGFCTDDGSGSNMPDAPASESGVSCAGVVCGAAQKCCADFVNGVSCVALGTTCNGFAATCDGVEDCGGSACCGDTQAIACSTGTACSNRVCREPADCDATEPMCCFNLGTNEPWGRCFANCP